MNEKCTVNRTANFIGKKWTMSIILELYKGKTEWKRYSHIKKNIKDITPKILSTRLKELEEHQMLKNRVDTSIVPIKSEYRLTSSGEDFINIVKDIKKWALKWNVKNKYCDRTDCENCEF